MVGKLNLDLGDDYAYDIRRAREVAEGGAQQQPVLVVEGPFKEQGVTYWVSLQTFTNAAAVVSVWFDVDADPEPDLAVPLKAFLQNPSIGQSFKDAVSAKVEALGWPV